MKSAEAKVYRVSEITRAVKSVIEREFGEIWIEGEISNLRRPSSGHMYFTLKDESAQIRAVLFRGSQARLKFLPKDGIAVRVCGRLTVYERSGDYQIIVSLIEEAGAGALQARFEALKAKLLKEGLFDTSRKRPLPALPQHVGIVTSPTGAAIKDILKVITRRFPNLHVVIAPVKVQGNGAAEEIAAGVELLNRIGGFDVIIVTRGGGSLEDLWAFNEEVVARAIAASAIPVISGVGHEIDFTISDFVADLRAPTPSAAAEMLIERKDTLENNVSAAGASLERAMRDHIRQARNRLETIARGYAFMEPRNLVRQYLQRLDGIEMRITHHVVNAAAEARRRLDESRVAMGHSLAMRKQTAMMDLKRVSTHLQALNPMAVLTRGYSMTTDSGGRILRSVEGLNAGDVVQTRLAKGSLESQIRKTYEHSKDGEKGVEN